MRASSYLGDIKMGAGQDGGQIWLARGGHSGLPRTRYFHRPADGSEVMYDAVSIMNADILNYCQKESWCKLAFYLLSFFYYLYR